MKLSTPVPRLLCQYGKCSVCQTIGTGRKEREWKVFPSGKASREAMTYTARTLDEIEDIAANKPGFIKAMWCGDRACEDALKEQAGITSRCIPLEQEAVADVCPVCGKKATKMLYWGKAY